MDYGDVRLRAAVYDLLDTAWPRISERIRIAEGLGARWHEVSTAFVAIVDDVPVAHTGVIAIPLVIDGERRVVAGVHAVCTRPEFRGRGHARAVLAEALTFVDRHFDAALLTTSIPELYARFGFRPVEEAIATFDGGPPFRSDRQARRLAADGADLQLLRDLLALRQPISYVLGAIDPGWLFLINEVLASSGLRRVYYIDALEVAVVFERDGGTLKLLDVVGADIPDLTTLLAHVPVAFERVELHFVPDRMAGVPYGSTPASPEDRLMVRGRIELPPGVMLPPLARC